MGNRATVIFWNGEHEERSRQEFSPAVYLHWNGGPESVYGFLEELDRRNVRADQDYEAARFVQIVGEFMDYSSGTSHSGLSLGITNGPKSDLLHDLERVQTDHGDNGFYLVDRTKEPLEVRRFTERPFRADDARWESAGTEYPPMGEDGWGPGFLLQLCEWSPEAVAREREEAESSGYRAAFREFYRSLDERLEEVTA